MEPHELPVARHLLARLHPGEHRQPAVGGGKDPFWQMAYTNCVRWIIQSYRVFPDPWFTFHDIYNCMVDKKALLEQVNAATEHVYGKYIYVLQMSRADFNQHREDLLTLQLWPPGVDPDTSVTSPCPGRAGFSLLVAPRRRELHFRYRFVYPPSHFS